MSSFSQRKDCLIDDLQLEFDVDMPEKLIDCANMASLGKLGRQVAIKSAWYIDNLLAEHSTLDWVSLVVRGQFRSDVISHLVRHTRHNPRFVVQSQRPDWTGSDRPKDPSNKRLFLSKWPLRALQAMARERLCSKSMLETRQTVEMIRYNLVKSSDPFKHHLGISLVPMCVYRSGCPYSKSCGFFGGHFGETPLNALPVWTRYELYSETQEEKYGREEG